MSLQLAVSRRSFAALRRLSSPLRLHVGRRSRQRRTALQALAVSHATTPPVRGWHSSCRCGATATSTTTSKLDEDDDAEPWTQKWNRPDIIHDAQWEKNLWRRDQLAASEAARNEGRLVQQEEAAARTGRYKMRMPGYEAQLQWRRENGLESTHSFTLTDHTTTPLNDFLEEALAEARGERLTIRDFAAIFRTLTAKVVRRHKHRLSQQAEALRPTGLTLRQVRRVPQMRMKQRSNVNLLLLRFPRNLDEELGLATLYDTCEVLHLASRALLVRSPDVLQPAIRVLVDHLEVCSAVQLWCGDPSCAWVKGWIGVTHILVLGVYSVFCFSRTEWSNPPCWYLMHS